MNTVKMRRKKMLLMLPVIAIPFITLGFWALGGGKGKKEEPVIKGLNPDLPDANVKDEKGFDKLSFYDKAEKDSLKLQEWMRSDPYFRKQTDTQPLRQSYELEDITNVTAGKFNQRLNTSPYEVKGKDPADEIMQKLKVLQDELNKPEWQPVLSPEDQDDTFTGELNRLEGMLKLNTGGGGDNDMQQLQGTLDKILDIQHPQRIKERSLKNKEAVYAVRKDAGVDTLVKGFFGFSDEKEMQDQNAVEATVAADQVIVNGAVIKFRLSTDIFVNGYLVPKDNIVSGIANLEGERLTVEINSIRCGKNLFNVRLEIYDMDGLPGIYIPGTINRDVAKESLNNSLSLADMTTLDPSFKAQATATGIGALKNLISKKAKMVRVQVKAGYKVLLKNKDR